MDSHFHFFKTSGCSELGEKIMKAIQGANNEL
jgi:hypothetical protein